jgi:hypothetical protein
MNMRATSDFTVAHLALGLVACLGIEVVATQAAFSCPANAGATFKDDFKAPSPRWIVDGNHSYFADGQLALKPEANGTTSVSVKESSLKSATFCLDIKSPADPNADLTGGLMFWRTDSKNYFTAVLNPGGTVSILMMANGAWTTLVPATKFAKLNAGPNATNEIRVTALGSLVTLYLNGAKAAETAIQAPASGGEFGVYAESTRDKRSEWRILDFNAAALANPAGQYNVKRGGTAGTVNVERTGDTFRVVWRINGRSIEGVGILDADVFSTAFMTGSEIGIANYTVSETGWNGLVRLGAAGEDTERWVRK